MSLQTVLSVAILLFLFGYLLYGRLVARGLKLQNANPTPAETMKDGIDFVPAKAGFLLGQHFSAITAAGPIVGPILAGLWFGWVPAILWIVFGAIFMGAVHDFSALVSSVRHKARSIAEVVGENMGRRAYLFFMGFIWISLVYVITAFTDLTSASFVEPTLGGGVATSSTLYLLLGCAMGLTLRILRCPLWLATLIYVPLVGLVIWFGQAIPLVIPATWGLSPQKIWNLVIIGYCFLASVLPVWFLLQPRGYLGGLFLYGALGGALIGIFLGGGQVEYPAFLGWSNAQGIPLVPMLFVTVACGACSGFHGIVGSGTTSKQIAKETDCRIVGYGGMLLEGLVAVIALATLMLLTPAEAAVQGQPDRIYANGLSFFVERLGIPREFARSFALLAFTTFIYDTLDVATRLGRYIVQELFDWKGSWARVGATLLTLALPIWFVMMTVTDASGKAIPGWKLFWTIFGTSNQLLAALSLLGVTIWLYRSRHPWVFTAIPMTFMLAMTLSSLTLLILPWVRQLLSGRFSFNVIAFVGTVLTLLALFLIFEGIRTVKAHKVPGQVPGT